MNLFVKWCTWNHGLRSTASSATSTNAVLLSTFSKTLLSKSDGKWLFIVLWSLYTHNIWILWSVLWLYINYQINNFFFIIIKINLFVKNPRTNFPRKKVWRVIFWIIRRGECEESQGLWFFVNITVFKGFLESEGTWKPWEGIFCESFADFW